ncbi:hypothetical protein BDQ17DRAFT_1181434, partial [Cyathus striatus]
RSNREKAKGLRACCEDIMELCWKEEGIRIKLTRPLVHCRPNGIKSRTCSNAEKSLLTDGEANALIREAIANAAEGFPLS